MARFTASSGVNLCVESTLTISCLSGLRTRQTNIEASPPSRNCKIEYASGNSSAEQAAFTASELLCCVSNLEAKLPHGRVLRRMRREFALVKIPCV